MAAAAPHLSNGTDWASSLYTYLLALQRARHRTMPLGSPAPGSRCEPGRSPPPKHPNMLPGAWLNEATDNPVLTATHLEDNSASSTAHKTRQIKNARRCASAAGAQTPHQNDLRGIDRHLAQLLHAHKLSHSRGSSWAPRLGSRRWGSLPPFHTRPAAAAAAAAAHSSAGGSSERGVPFPQACQDSCRHRPHCARHRCSPEPPRRPVQRRCCEACAQSRSMPVSAALIEHTRLRWPQVAAPAGGPAATTAACACRCTASERHA